MTRSRISSRGSLKSPRSTEKNAVLPGREHAGPKKFREWNLMKRCLIVTAGPMGPYEPLKQLVRENDFIVCADGGLLHARNLGLRADAVVGDFDSLKTPVEEGIRVLRYKSEKAETDTILAIDLAIAEGCNDFLILGGLRGRLDHTFANLSALLYLHSRGFTGHIADADNEAYILLPGEMRLRRREGWYVSVFPFGGEALGVTERGMKYSLEDAKMDCAYPNGVSNEFKDDEAVIFLKNGTLLIILSKE
jgi:thiamine pyrophosphokinase